MALIKPRLNDYNNLSFTQEQVNFAIPFLDEDVPLYVDPFLLWKSPATQDNALHSLLVSSFNYLGTLSGKGKKQEAVEMLKIISECDEVGLGLSAQKKGVRIGDKLTEEIVSLFEDIPQIQKNGFLHFEEIQLLVDQISKDRISDIACNLLKSFLIDYTIDQSKTYNIPLQKATLNNLWNTQQNKFVKEELELPVNPDTGLPLLLVPKRWLRFIPWLNYEDYFGSYFIKNNTIQTIDRVQVLNYNRKNYDMVQTYIQFKEREQADCKNDPLFKPIPILSAQRKLTTILKLPSGKVDNADKKYEDNVCQMMASLMYPHLDFADTQSRTDSGVLIRDLIFYNNTEMPFLKDIYEQYDCRQIVMELKNVKEIEREHINQLNRYLADVFGRFGIIITRNSLPKPMFQNTIDLWAGQRRCIIALTDEDLKLMVSLFQNKQRLPIEVIKKKYVEFIRSCPS